MFTTFTDSKPSVCNTDSFSLNLDYKIKGMGEVKRLDTVHQYNDYVRGISLLKGTHLGRTIRDYSFFAYEVNEALQLSEKEKRR